MGISYEHFALDDYSLLMLLYEYHLMSVRADAGFTLTLQSN
jgi:hypothetical protein